MTVPTSPPPKSSQVSSEAAILQYVVDNIPYLIFWKDRSSVYLGCNKNFAALDGKSDPRALIGRTDFDMGKYAPHVSDEVRIEIAVEAIKEG